LKEHSKKGEKEAGNSLRMDETYIKVKGEWMYLYRAVDKEGNTVDFLLTKRRNKRAAQLFLLKAIHNHDKPLTINTQITQISVERTDKPFGLTIKE
jgi:putative transposase